MDAAKSLISMHLCDVLEQARLGKVRRQAPATKKQQSQVKQKMTDHWSLITDHFIPLAKTKLLTCFISLITDNKTFLLSLLNNTIQQRTWHDSCGSWKPKPTPNPKLHRPAWEAHDPWGISACLPRSRRRNKVETWRLHDLEGVGKKSWRKWSRNNWLNPPEFPLRHNVPIVNLSPPLPSGGRAQTYLFRYKRSWSWSASEAPSTSA